MFFDEIIRRLINGSQVRALVRPPLQDQVLTEDPESAIPTSPVSGCCDNGLLWSQIEVH
ncbi:hypothetical protein [Bradyrhizobium sp. 142]|uniref:hypothetical protein n=1 Tax=Bradyrhizobium sp. 142 TaxID=2782618 RepID=UPI001FFACB21|nr:hypothetical protein [Bradyrhizobium sp. 142]MCK1730001.1 hypothetical protein [Bradyrhizobium sp. 142]